MDVKFNSLFNEVSSGNYYDVSYTDNIGLDPRIKENTLILNYDEEDLNYQRYLDNRRYGDLPVTVISGRPCSTQLCTSTKFCESTGLPYVFHKVPSNCNNDFLPNATSGNVDKYMQNIDIEARLFNIDYKQKKDGCGGKEYKSNELDKNSCYNFKENTTIVPKNFKNEKPNNQCDKYIPNLGFGKSSKRITNENW
tara:strand:+ start:3071 stop:3655 length:585 start_codon:yes stop_codon:yes gene_type:complete